METALACPSCYTSDVVRAMAFGPGFWANLLSIALPFIVTALVALAFTRLGAPRAPRREPRP